MNNLALAYKMANRLDKAVAIYEETCALVKDTFGESHSQTLIAMNNLARAYQAQVMLEKALPLFEKALKIAEDKGGDQMTLITLTNLAEANLEAGQWAEAKGRAERGLHLLDDTLKLNDWRRYHTISLLGAALAGQKQYVEAQRLLEEAREGLKNRQSEIPVTRKKCLADAGARLVTLYDDSNQPEKAAKLRTELELALHETTESKH